MLPVSESNLVPMINDALRFTRDELNTYLLRKDIGLAPTVKNCVLLENVTRIQDNSNGTNPGTDLQNKVFITLVNMEEDRVSKSPMNYRKVNDTVEYRNPKIHLNLYCLFAMHFGSYEMSLKVLSYVMQFFQYRNVFDPAGSPALPPAIDKLIFDLHSLNFEQINHLWGTLGGKYLPSVLYKVRLVVIEDETPGIAAEPILHITVHDKTTAG